MSPRKLTSPNISPIIKPKHTRPPTPATPNNSEATPTKHASSVSHSPHETEDDFSGYSSDLSHEAVSPDALFDFSEELEEKRSKQSPRQHKSMPKSFLFSPITNNNQKSTVIADYKNIFRK